MGLKETYRRDYRDSFVGNTALVTHIQCTNGDGQVFIKLAEKWTDIFNRWAPGEDEHLAFKALLTGEVPPEKENFLDEFSLEAIDEADMPAPFDKYFLPWKKVEEKFAKFHIEEYGKRFCIRGKSKTGATVCICYRLPKNNKFAGDFFVWYKPSEKAKTVLTYIVTDSHSPRTFIKEFGYSKIHINMNFYLDFDKGDDNYIVAEGTQGMVDISEYDRKQYQSWSHYEESGLRYSCKETDAGYNDFHFADEYLGFKLDEASDRFFRLIQEHEGTRRKKKEQKEWIEQHPDEAEEKLRDLEKQNSLLDSLDSI